MEGGIMFLQKALHMVTKLMLGQQMASALLLLRLIANAAQERKVENVARFVYGKLPAQWRHPEGPATEAEFVALIEAGQVFLDKLRAVLNA
jgi:hypothetical protein